MQCTASGLVPPPTSFPPLWSNPSLLSVPAEIATVNVSWTFGRLVAGVGYVGEKMSSRTELVSLPVSEQPENHPHCRAAAGRTSEPRLKPSRPIKRADSADSGDSADSLFSNTAIQVLLPVKSAARISHIVSYVERLNLKQLLYF